MITIPLTLYKVTKYMYLAVALQLSYETMESTHIQHHYFPFPVEVMYLYLCVFAKDMIQIVSATSWFCHTMSPQLFPYYELFPKHCHKFGQRVFPQIQLRLLLLDQEFLKTKCMTDLGIGVI